MRAALERIPVFRAIEELSRESRAFEKAMALVPIFYYFILYEAISIFFSGETIYSFPQSNFSPAWPLFWSAGVSFHSTLLAVELVFLVTAFAAALWYRYRITRILSLVGIMQYHALISSFGARDHGWILMTAIAFFFVLLPSAWSQSEITQLDRKKFLAVFWGATAFLFLIYAMAGTGKVIGAFQQFQAGVPTAFSPEASALHIADWAQKTGMIGLLGAFLIRNTYLGWPGFVGILLVQVGSWVVMFIPRLYRLWGALFIVLHVLIFFSMGIKFVEAIIPVALFMLDSPLAMRPKSSVF